MFEVQEIHIDEGVNRKTNSTKKYRRIFMDIEAGLDFGEEVLQVAYLETDWDMHILNAYNSYFQNTRKISDGAFNVHGLTSEFIWRNASTYFTAEVHRLPFFHTENYMYISYTDFDIRKIREVYFQNDIETRPFGELWASSLTKYPEISLNFDAYSLGKGKLQSTLGSGEKERLDKLIKIPFIGKLAKNLKAHDAFFDVLMLYLLCKKWWGVYGEV